MYLIITKTKNRRVQLESFVESLCLVEADKWQSWNMVWELRSRYVGFVGIARYRNRV